MAMSRHWYYIYIYYGKFRADEPPLVLYCIYSGKFRAYEPPLVGVVVPEPEEPEHHDGVVGGAGGLVVLYSEPHTSHTGLINLVYTQQCVRGGGVKSQNWNAA